MKCGPDGNFTNLFLANGKYQNLSSAVVIQAAIISCIAQHHVVLACVLLIAEFTCFSERRLANRRWRKRETGVPNGEVVPRGSNHLHNRLTTVVSLDAAGWTNGLQWQDKQKNGGLPERVSGPRWVRSAVARNPSTVGSGRYSLLCETSLTHCPPL
jgi:hypothetical protein